MALYQSKQVKARVPAYTPTEAVDLVPVVGEFIVPTGLTLNDVIEFGTLPANTIPVDLIVAAEDLDTGATPTITLNAGILSGTAGKNDATRTCGAEFLAASNVGQAGGVTRAAVGAGLLLAPSESDRGFGLKVSAAAATLAVGAKIRVTLLVAPAPVGIDLA